MVPQILVGWTTVYTIRPANNYIVYFDISSV